MRQWVRMAKNILFYIPNRFHQMARFSSISICQLFKLDVMCYFISGYVRKSLPKYVPSARHIDTHTHTHVHTIVYQKIYITPLIVGWDQTRSLQLNLLLLTSFCAVYFTPPSIHFSPSSSSSPSSAKPRRKYISYIN